MSPEHRHHSLLLYRAKYGRVAGICAGIAERYNLSTHTVRSAFLLLMVVTLGMAGVIYLVLWQILPVREGASEPVDVVPYTAHSMRYHLVSTSAKHSESASFHIANSANNNGVSGNSTNASPHVPLPAHPAACSHAESSFYGGADSLSATMHHDVNESSAAESCDDASFHGHASFASASATATATPHATSTATATPHATSTATATPHVATPTHSHPFMPPQATKRPFERLKEKWRYWLQDDLSSVPFIARIALSVGLFIMFTFIVLSGSFLFPHSQWWYFWPLLFMALGMICIVVPVNDFYYCVALHIAGVGVTLFSGALLPCCLGVLSWLTWLNAIMYLWPFIAFALVLYFMGVLRNSIPLMLVSLGIFAICVAIVLFVLYVPGDVQTVCLHGLGTSDFCLFSPDGTWIL